MTGKDQTYYAKLQSKLISYEIILPALENIPQILKAASLMTSQRCFELLLFELVTKILVIT